MGALLLLLSDARFPAGGHAHSGGVEEAAGEGLVDDGAGLRDFLVGRLLTVGTLGAFAAAAVCAQARAVPGRPPPVGPLRLLLREADVEIEARTASAAARATSRRLGGQWLRATSAVVGGPVLGPAGAALLAAQGAVAGPASAVVRLLGRDPLEVAGILAGLAPDLDRTARAAAAASSSPFALLPAPGAPVLDLLAETHADRKERLFAS